MRRLAIASLMLSGCSAIFMERAPETRSRQQPVACTGSKGFAIWDGALVLAHGASAVVAFNLASDAPNKGTLQAIGAIDIAFLVGHLVSGAMGSQWADDCRKARTDEDVITEAPIVRSYAQAVSNERKTVYGAVPLFCAVTSADAGECWQNRALCDAALEASGAAACEERQAGSCFTATKVLDESKATTCAVSISDCETRRKIVAENPDFRVTACGVYRQEKR
jgi:hypothetical protein